MGIAACRTGGGAGTLTTGLVAVMLERDLARCLVPAGGSVFGNGGTIGGAVAVAGGATGGGGVGGSAATAAGTACSMACSASCSLMPATSKDGRLSER